MTRYRFVRRKREAEKVEQGRPPVGGPYHCYRCGKGTHEWTFDPCERCGFDGPDTRWWLARLVDKLKAIQR